MGNDSVIFVNAIYVHQSCAELIYRCCCMRRDVCVPWLRPQCAYVKDARRMPSIYHNMINLVLVLRSGDRQVALWILRCWNLVLAITMFCVIFICFKVVFSTLWHISSICKWFAIENISSLCVSLVFVVLFWNVTPSQSKVFVKLINGNQCKCLSN